MSDHSYIGLFRLSYILILTLKNCFSRNVFWLYNYSYAYCILCCPCIVSSVFSDIEMAFVTWQPCFSIILSVFCYIHIVTARCVVRWAPLYYYPWIVIWNVFLGESWNFHFCSKHVIDVPLRHPLQNVLCRLTVAIQKTKEKEAEEGLADVVEQGWLIKEGPNESRRKRYSFLNVFRI